MLVSLLYRFCFTLLYRIDLFHAVDGICKDSGASIMAKSLFAQLPHRTLKKAVIFQQQNDDVVIEEGSNFEKHGNIKGHFHDVLKAFSFHGLHHTIIGPHIF